MAFNRQISAHISENVKLVMRLLRLMLLLPSLLVSPDSNWELAPRIVLEDAYFPYELCLLDNARNEVFDTSKTIHEQPSCTDFIDPLLNLIPKRCWLGSRQQRVDDGVCVKPKSFRVQK